MSSPGSSTSKQLHNFQLPDLWRAAGRLRDCRRGAGPSSKSSENQEAHPAEPPTGKNDDKKKEKQEENDRREEKQEEDDLPQLPQVSLQLNLEEISEDMYSITGKLPSRNMKKNTKDVQKQIDVIFPGGSLGKLTADRYKVSKTSKKAN